jgi:uncharacterized protein
MNNTQKFIITLLGLAGLIAIVVLALVYSSTPKPDQQLSVQAEGKVTAIPNIAQINLGVTINNERSAETATSKGVELMNKVVEAVKQKGVEGKDIRTVNYNLYPNYNYTQERGQVLGGWNLDQTVMVKIRQLDTIGEIISSATAVGANQAGNISFTIDDTEERKNQARAEAITKAKAKAQMIAEQTGIKLGDVINMYEDNISYPQPFYARADTAAGLGGGGAAPQIEPGENEITVNVSLVYEVE